MSYAQVLTLLDRGILVTFVPFGEGWYIHVMAPADRTAIETMFGPRRIELALHSILEANDIAASIEAEA